MITWTEITDAPTQLDYTTEYLLAFLDEDGNEVYHLGYYVQTNANGDVYAYSLPTNKEPLLNATHFTTINTTA